MRLKITDFKQIYILFDAEFSAFSLVPVNLRYFRLFYPIQILILTPGTGIHMELGPQELVGVSQ